MESTLNLLKMSALAPVLSPIAADTPSRNPSRPHWVPHLQNVNNFGNNPIKSSQKAPQSIRMKLALAG